jgi:hypothetical protein
MAEKQLSILVKLRDDATAQMRALNGEIRQHQREWKAMFGAIAMEAQRLGTVMTGVGASILAPLTLSVKSALTEMRDAIKKSQEEIKVSYAPGVTITKTVNNSGYSDAEISRMKELVEQFDRMKQTIDDLVNTIGGVFLQILLDAFNAIKPIIEGITQWIVQNPELARQIMIVALVVGTLAAAMGGLLLLIGSIGLAFGALAGPIGIISVAILALGAAVTWVALQWNDTMGALGSAFASIANVVASGIEYWINGVVELLNLIPRAINMVTGAFGSDFQISLIPNVSIPRMAAGGIVNSPTLALIGEAGPEAVVPLNSGGMGGNVNIYVAGSIISEDQLITKVRTGLLRVGNRNYGLGLS